MRVDEISEKQQKVNELSNVPQIGQSDKRVATYLTPAWGDIPRLISGQAGQEVVAFCCRGKLWLEERSPEQLKGEAV